MRSNSVEDHVLITCRGCGNMGLNKKVAEYKQDLLDYCDGEPQYIGESVWTVLECPVCQNISLHVKHSDEQMMYGGYNTEPIEEVVFPVPNRQFPNAPDSIVESYNAARKTLKIDASVSLIAIRRVLEMICKERGCKKKTLEAMLKDMVNKNILPDTLDQCGYLIRKLGNNGAHGDESFHISRRDIEELIDFTETIMYYIYELPMKIDKLNQKYLRNAENTDNTKNTENNDTEE